MNLKELIDWLWERNINFDVEFDSSGPAIEITSEFRNLLIKGEGCIYVEERGKVAELDSIDKLIEFIKNWDKSEGYIPVEFLLCEELTLGQVFDGIRDLLNRRTGYINLEIKDNTDMHLSLQFNAYTERYLLKFRVKEG